MRIPKIKPYVVTLRVKDAVVNRWNISAPTRTLAWLNFRYQIGYPELTAVALGDAVNARYTVYPKKGV